MSITLLAIVVALVLGHIAQAQVAALRRFDWYQRWLQWLSAQLGESAFWRGRYGIAVALLPPLLLVLLVQWWLRLPLLGFLGMLFAIAVLVYSWGPRDLDVDVEAVLDAYDAPQREAALARLWPEGETPRNEATAMAPAVLRSALQRWFGVLFWFLLLGPAGALLYRLATLAALGPQHRVLPAEALAGARRLQAMLDWPVAQLMTLGMALVGHFDAVSNAWRQAGGNRMALGSRFLEEAARASVCSELDDEIEDFLQEGQAPALQELPELRDAMSLVWRVLLLWMAVMALFVIAGWVS